MTVEELEARLARAVALLRDAEELVDAADDIYSVALSKRNKRVAEYQVILDALKKARGGTP